MNYTWKSSLRSEVEVSFDGAIVFVLRQPPIAHEPPALLCLFLFYFHILQVPRGSYSCIVVSNADFLYFADIERFELEYIGPASLEVVFGIVQLAHPCKRRLIIKRGGTRGEDERIREQRRDIPVLPVAPNIVMDTLASVPAPRKLPVEMETL